MDIAILPLEQNEQSIRYVFEVILAVVIED